MTQAVNGAKTILVVDDEESTLELFRFFLGKDGYHIISAESGVSALQKLRTPEPESRPVDLVILDLMMPGSSGYDVLREMQQDPYRDIPILIVTARNLDQTTADMLRVESNVQGIWQKPVNQEQFKAKLKQILGSAA